MAEGIRHFTDIRNIDKTALVEILRETPNMESLVKLGGSDQLKGRMYYFMFYHPSNLTLDSFVRAVDFLGGRVWDREVPKQSGWNAEVENLMESISDLKYDCLILRGYQVGDAKRAASVSKIPVINAGEFSSNEYLDFSQHPTQAIADLRTIYERHPNFGGLRIVFAGDVKSHPTVNSLLVATSLFKGIDLTIAASSKTGGLDGTFDRWLEEQHVSVSRVSTTEAAKQVLADADVVYLARSRRAEREVQVRANDNHTFQIEEALSALSPNAMVLHDMLRGEKPDTASHPQAVWVRQRQNNLFTKMALLTMLDYRANPNS